MESYIDLHVHSTASDGTMRPDELVFYAKDKGLVLIALTDHDTIDGIPAAREAAKAAGIRLIPGIELSTQYLGRDIHMVGLNLDVEDPVFVRKLTQFLDSRNLRNRRMIQLLRENGVDITWEAMQKKFPDSVWTRAHFGRFLMENGYVETISDAFTTYIGEDCPCFVPREKVTPQQAVALIHQGGGIAILAHPVMYHLNGQELDTLVSLLVAAGLDGIEVMYSRNRAGDEERFRALAEKYRLQVSGGSDFHGANKPDIEIGTGMGNLHIPLSVWETLKTNCKKS